MGTYCDFVVSIEIKSFTMKTPIISMNLTTKSHCRLTHRVNGGGSKENNLLKHRHHLTHIQTT